jgi:hypothetical protein
MGGKPQDRLHFELMAVERKMDWCLGIHSPVG